MAYIVEEISLAAIRKAQPKKIYYGALTCWWTHNPAHLCRHPQSGLPCDPRGGVLYETEDVEGFLRTAEQNAEKYGRHGLRAFVAAHHQNCRVSKEDRRSTCLRTWEEYNAALDALDAQEEAKVTPS